MTDRHPFMAFSNSLSRRETIVAAAMAFGALTLCSTELRAQRGAEISHTAESIHQEVEFQASRKRGTGNDNIQFLIATHSPMLLAYPGAQIFSFDGGKIRAIGYRESPAYRLVSNFLAAPERYMELLFSELPFNRE